MIRLSSRRCGALLRRPALIGVSGMNKAKTPVTTRLFNQVASPPYKLNRSNNQTFSKFYRTNNYSFMLARALSSGSSNKSSDGGNNKKASDVEQDENSEDSKEIVLTPGEKVAVASRLSMWLGVGVFACFCGYYIIKELIPTKMSPNRAFDRSFEIIKNDPEVKRRYGDSLKAYGRDHGGHREGRRNFIEHTEYTDREDGSKRVRVRYNLESRISNAFVFAEVSSDMPSGEFVYILLQDKANGRVLTVVDNRAALTAQRLAAGSKEMQSAMSQLLGGSDKK